MCSNAALAADFADLVQRRGQPSIEVIVHLLANPRLVVIGAQFRAGKVVIGCMIERRYAFGAKALRDCARRI